MSTVNKPQTVQNTLDYCGNVCNISIQPNIFDGQCITICNTFPYTYDPLLFQSLNNMSEEEQLSYLALHGCRYIVYIVYPSERVQLALLHDDINWYQCINNPCEAATQYVNNKKNEMIQNMIKEIEQW